ncbi:MAG TPA: branched-chain amino acid ABC transporter permease [Limnochordia bacterium]|nr:branched-chain amino acid ABC transporter permease [Limnochordia bacterium]
MLQVLIYGLISGSIYALGGIGVSLIFGVLGFAHFAHGDLMTLGAYVMLALVVAGVPIWLSFLIALPLTGLAAVLIDRLVYARLRRTGPITLLIASIGVALVVRNLIQLIWGPQNQVYRQGIQMPWRWLLQHAGVRVKPTELLTIAVAAGLAIGVQLFLHRTRAGKAMRAVADNPDLAAVSGIDPERVARWCWLIGGALAAAAGALYGMETHLLPTLGWDILLPIFAGVILGGVGSPTGAMLGGLALGVIQEASTLVMPAQYKPLVAFVLMILILLLRPGGITGAGVGRRAA